MAWKSDDFPGESSVFVEDFREFPMFDLLRATAGTAGWILFGSMVSCCGGFPSFHIMLCTNQAARRKNHDTLWDCCIVWWAFWSLQKGHASWLAAHCHNHLKGFCNFVCTASPLNLGCFLASGIEIWWYLTNLGVGHWGQKWYIQRYTKHLTVFLSPSDFLKHGHKFQLWRSHRHVDDEWRGVLRGILSSGGGIASYGECSKLSLPWFNDGHHLFIHKVSRINCGVAMKFLPWFCCMPCSSILALSLFPWWCVLFRFETPYIVWLSLAGEPAFCEIIHT